MLPLFGTAVHAVLPHQDETDEKDAFDLNQDGEQRKGKRIEDRHPAVRHRIEQQPGAEPDDMQQNKRETADKAADGVAELFDPRMAGLELLLLLSDGLDVFLNVGR